MSAKVILTIVIFFILIKFSFSQVIITSSDMPVAGDTLRYSIASPDIDYDFEMTGENFFWNYSGLDTIGQGLEEYKYAYNVHMAYVMFFGMDGYGLKTSDSTGFGDFMIHDMYDFYHLDNTVFKAEGRGMTFQGMPIPSFYSDADEIYLLPLEYCNKDSTTFAVTTALADFLTIAQSGSRVNEVVGWGVIITPYDTLEVIKVKTIIDQIDTITISGLPFPIVTHSVTQEYKWLAHGEKYPVLKVSGSLMNDNFMISDITYRDIYHQSLDPATYVGFLADTTIGYTTDVFTLMDTSLINGFRIWSISPVDFEYVNGTGDMSENPEVMFSAAGYYTVKMTKYTDYGNVNVLKTDYIYVMDSEDINDPSAKNDINVFPVPAHNIINVVVNEYKETGTVTIFDINGRQMKNIRIRGSGVIDISGMTPGVYILRYANEEITGVCKVVVQ